MDFVVIQFLNGLASASDLFLVSAGLSIIFGVTRIVNFAHGSFYMLGGYCAFSLSQALANGPFGFWAGVIGAAAFVAILGGLLEATLLKRIYRAPELFQLLATFGVVLIVQDLVLMLWGAEDRSGPRAPGLDGAIPILGYSFPTYDLFLIALGPVVLALLWAMFRWTRWGVLVRAATEDREMVAVLGVNQDRLFTSVFLLGTFLAGLGGALQLPREAIHHTMDVEMIVEAFVVVVIGGLGSVTGAYLASVLIGLLSAFGIVVFPQVTLVLVFLVMAIVLILRPHGLLGRPELAIRSPGSTVLNTLRPQSPTARTVVLACLLALLCLPAFAGPYALSVASEILIFVLFAMSLHFLMGIGGMISFGHAAYFGLGAYGVALAVMHGDMSMETALIAGPVLGGFGAVLFGWFCVRLTGVYLAMLTLAFAQITWSIVYQWYDVTGGDNGILGVWPAAWASTPEAFYYLTLAITGAGGFVLRRIIFAPFGYALRACRDSSLRAEAIGIDRRKHQWMGFAVAGTCAAIAGALYAFLKGSVFPDTIGISVSVDGLVMVLLGGIQTLNGPIIGAVVYKLLQILLSSYTDAWRMVIGVVIIVLVAAFPQGIAGFVSTTWTSIQNKRKPAQ